MSVYMFKIFFAIFVFLMFLGFYLLYTKVPKIKTNETMIFVSAFFTTLIFLPIFYVGIFYLSSIYLDQGETVMLKKEIISAKRTPDLKYYNIKYLDGNKTKLVKLKEKLLFSNNFEKGKSYLFIEKCIKAPDVLYYINEKKDYIHFFQPRKRCKDIEPVIYARIKKEK